MSAGMNVKREDLLECLKLARPATEKRSTMGILSSIWFHAQDNRITIRATNLDVFVECSCDCDGSILNPCCVPLEPLMAMLSTEAEAATINTDDVALHIECGAEARIAVQKPDEFPKWPEYNLENLGVNPVDLGQCIQAVEWAADPKSQKNYMFQGVHVILGKKIITAVASDGVQVCVVERPAIVPDAKFVLPVIQTKMLLHALFSEGAGVSLNENWIMGESKNYKCAVKLLEGKTIDHTLVSKNKEEPVGDIPRAELLRHLSLLSSLTQGDQWPEVSLTPSKKGLEIRYDGHTNQFHAVVPVNATTPQCATQSVRNLVVVADAGRLRDLIYNTPGESLKYSTARNAMFWRSGEVLSMLATIARS